jgi:O-antigen/teichoic acid export membrane protein
MNVDQVMIEYMVGSKSVGIYATAVKISELWYFIPTIVASTIFPKIVETKESYSEKVYRERMQSLYDVMSMISYLIVVPLAITAHPVIDIFFGSEFNESAVILQVHIWAFIFVSLGVIRGKWLIAENMTTFSMIAAGIGAIVNVTLNVLLIPESAGVGAAWATLFAQVTATYLTCFLLSKTRSRALPQMTRALYLPFRIRNAYSGIKKVLLS